MTQMTSQKRLLFLSIMWAIPLILCLVIGWVIYRKTEASLASLTARSTEVTPDVSVYENDPVVGYRAKAGEYRLVERVKDIPGELSYNVKIESDHSRSTGSKEMASDLPEIWIFGCSFTFGQGLNDNQTYPALLQQQYPQYKVINFGQNGYGTIHALRQLQELAKADRKPAAIVLGHVPWHDQRNVGDKPFLEALYWLSTFHKGSLNGIQQVLKYRIERLFLGREKASRMAGFSFPVASLSPDEKTLNIKTVPLLPVMDDVSDQDPVKVTRKILEEISTLSQNKWGIRPIVLRLWKYRDGSDPLDQDYVKLGFVFQDAYVDYSLPEFNLLPWNSHPNEKANLIYSQKLAQVLATPR